VLVRLAYLAVSNAFTALRPSLQRSPSAWALCKAALLHPTPEPIAEQARIIHLDVRRRDRLGGILHEYEHAS
jgi:hypothetical protein